MIGIFFKNLFKNLLTILVVTAVTVILTFIIVCVTECSGDLVMALQGKDTPFDLSPKTVLIIDAVIAVIIAFCWFAVASVTGEWFYTGQDDNVKHPPFLLFGIIWLALVPTVVCYFSTNFMITGYDRMVAGIEASSHAESPFCWELFFFLVLPAISVSQVLFFLTMLKHYWGWQVCTHCLRMFCFNYVYGDSYYNEIEKYKTTTSREKLGTISVGDKKINVAADVKRGHYETTVITHDTYHGECVRCGEKREKMSTH